MDLEDQYPSFYVEGKGLVKKIKPRKAPEKTSEDSSNADHAGISSKAVLTLTDISRGDSKD